MLVDGTGRSDVTRTPAAVAEQVTGHSCAGRHHSTLAGVGLGTMAAETRHRSLSTLLESYIRPTEALQVTSGRDLGLWSAVGDHILAARRAEAERPRTVVVALW